MKKRGERMASVLAYDEFEEFKYHYENGEIGDIKYLDTWDFEDDYSHNEIDAARDEFIKMANEFLDRKQSIYYMREVNKNAMLCYKNTDVIVRSSKSDPTRKIVAICELFGSFADVNQIVDACEKVGVHVRNDDGTYRNFDDVLSDLSIVYSR